MALIILEIIICIAITTIVLNTQHLIIQKKTSFIRTLSTIIALSFLYVLIIKILFKMFTEI